MVCGHEQKLVDYIPTCDRYFGSMRLDAGNHQREPLHAKHEPFHVIEIESDDE
jgi:truncated hemoglobin YjbI